MELTIAPGAFDPTPTWQTSDVKRIPIERFGRDHWSTFIYVEIRVVDYKGMLDPDQVRCSPSLHPMLVRVGRRKQFAMHEAQEHPTRLKTPARRDDGKWGTEEIAPHDDYCCLDDLVAAGLLRVEMPHPAADIDVYLDAAGRRIGPRMFGDEPPRPSLLTGMEEQRLMAAARWFLTPLGHAVAGQLRRWKSDGGVFHQFEPDMAAARAVAGE